MDLVMSGFIKMLVMFRYFYTCLQIALSVVTSNKGQVVYSTRLSVKQIKRYNHCLNPENMFRFKLPLPYIKAFAKYRCSNRKFLIETGRHLGIQHDLTYCPNCLKVQNTCVIQNKFHIFLLFYISRRTLLSFTLIQWNRRTNRFY